MLNHLGFTKPQIIGGSGYLSMNTAAWQPPRTVPEAVNVPSIRTTNASRGAMIRHDRSKQAAARALVGRFLHLGPRGAHDPRAHGPHRRGLRPQPLLHRAL